MSHSHPFDLPLLPPKIDYISLISEIANAHTALARLDETLIQLENPQIIESTFLTREAVLSSQIEGTQATFEEVLKEEATGVKNTQTSAKLQDIQEVVNYRKAIQYGAELVEQGEVLAENNIKRIHRILLQSVRGKGSAPGEFRRSQVYIASPGVSIANARYVPPNPIHIPELYSNFDKYLNTPESEKDPLVQIAVAHYQFEAIHPFADGNGRVGRLIIPLFLYEKKIISKPYIYVSKYFETNRREYYDLLANVSYADAWLPWIQFFLRGLAIQATDSLHTVRQILDLKHKYHDDLASFHSPYALNLIDALFVQPIFTTTNMRKLCGIQNIQTFINLIRKFESAGYIKDLTPNKQRNKMMAFTPLLDILDINSKD